MCVFRLYVRITTYTISTLKKCMRSNSFRNMDQQLPPSAPESEPKVPTSSPQPPQMEKAEDTANSEQSAPVSSISRFVFWLQQYRRLLIILVGGMLILGAIAGLIFMKSKS